MAFSRITLLGLPLDVEGDEADILQPGGKPSGARLIDILGPEVWALAKKDPSYAEKLQQMSLVIPDGMGIALACFLLTRKTCRWFPFDMTALAKTFFSGAAKNKTSLILVGGRPRDDEDVLEKLVKTFPGLNIIDTIHGYGDLAPKIAAIKEKAPQAVVLSMELPRRETFMLALREAGYGGLVLGTEGFIERYASKIDYLDLPEQIRAYHLTPLYKLAKEPQRLWQRYYLGYRTFAFLVAAELYRRARELVETFVAQVKKQIGSTAKN